MSGHPKPVLRMSTSDELSQAAWAAEAEKREPENLLAALRQLVTLSVGLLAGSAALFVQPGIPIICKAVSAAFLLLSLWTALRGALPVSVTIRGNDPDAIRDFRNLTRSRRVAAIAYSSYAMLAAFVVAFVGLFIAALAG